MINNLVELGEKVATQIAKILVRANIKPIQVTVLRFAIAAPASLYFFSRGEYLYNVIGLFVYMALAILDWTDGEMARLYKLPKNTAPFGRLIDHISDRVLMLIVLGTLMFAGMRGSNSQIWTIVTVLYYSFFFFLTTLLFEFDKMFGLHFEEYPKLSHEMRKINHTPNATDRFLYNLLYVHNNSIAFICFTHNYVLIVGILTNQLLLCFIFFTFMLTIRSIGVFLIIYKTLKIDSNGLAITSVLRKYYKG